MKPTALRLIAIWSVGAAVGTLIIAITSPLFVRSYVPLHADPIRGTWTLPEGHLYRWRSEGYADTAIGPLGMPGRTSIGTSDKQTLRVALWGDSQAEGVCVADRQKLFAQAEEISGGKLIVLPLARSGEDAADWVTQMPAVERELEIDVHVLLIVDLPDLVAASAAPVAPPSESDVAQANAAIAARLPAFVIQAARHLLTESDEVTPRKLRFNIGPLPPPKKGSGLFFESDTFSEANASRWTEPLSALRAASDLPILILYAPKAPHIVAGRVTLEDPSADEFEAMKLAARNLGSQNLGSQSPLRQSLGIEVADARPLLLQSAERGRWPHGFHNGFIGSGHLNPRGYAVVGSMLVDRVLETVERRK